MPHVKETKKQARDAGPLRERQNLRDGVRQTDGSLATARFLQRCLGNSRLQPPVIQAKLTIGQPGDKYEREADRVADMVMRMPDPQLQRKPDEDQNEEKEEENIDLKPLSGQITPLVQRQMDDEVLEGEEEEEEKEEDVELEDEVAQAKAYPGRTPVVSPGLQARINALRGGGQPLDPATRAFIEPRFGRDFSRVRVHTGRRAADTARALNARAFTVGRDVVFGKGQCAPGEDAGRQLMAHELAHVVQQDGQPVRCQSKWKKRTRRKKTKQSTISESDIVRARGAIEEWVWSTSAPMSKDAEQLRDNLRILDSFVEVYCPRGRIKARREKKSQVWYKRKKKKEYEKLRFIQFSVIVARYQDPKLIKLEKAWQPTRWVRPKRPKSQRFRYLGNDWYEREKWITVKKEKWRSPHKRLTKPIPEELQSTTNIGLLRGLIDRLTEKDFNVERAEIGKIKAALHRYLNTLTPYYTQLRNLNILPNPESPIAWPAWDRTCAVTSVAMALRALGVKTSDFPKKKMALLWRIGKVFDSEHFKSRSVLRSIRMPDFLQLVVISYQGPKTWSKKDHEFKGQVKEARKKAQGMIVAPDHKVFKKVLEQFGVGLEKTSSIGRRRNYREYARVVKREIEPALDAGEQIVVMKTKGGAHYVRLEDIDVCKIRKGKKITGIRIADPYRGRGYFRSWRQANNEGFFRRYHIFSTRFGRIKRWVESLF
jgi:hypothetical protein